MIDTPTMITIVISMATMSIASMGFVVQTLGARITDLGNRMDGFDSRVETRLTAVEGAIRDLGARVTRREH